MLTTIRRCWRSITSDRTRCSIAVAFVAVGLLFWARLIVIQDMPRMAVAEPEVVTPAQEPVPEDENREEEAADEERP